MANVASLASAALTAGNGVLRLAPTCVPRSFLQPGRRLKLHPDEYYALGMHRGGIDDRWVDKWIVYVKVDGKQLFTAKELSLEPGAKCKIKDGGAYGLITVQGYGRIGKLTLQSPNMIRFGAMTEDEVFVTAKAAADGVEFKNTGTSRLYRSAT